MPEIERFGTAGTCDRELFLLQLSDFSELPHRLPLEGPHFVCLVVCDATNAGTVELGRFSESLLSQGAVYLMCWGPDCERLRDIIDDTIVGDREPMPRFDTSILTCGRVQEPLDDVLNVFLGSSWPDDKFSDSCRSAVAVCVAQPRWCSRVREALRDPAEFFRGIEEGAA
jgi:hypothetical protein